METTGSCNVHKQNLLKFLISLSAMGSQDPKNVTIVAILVMAMCKRQDSYQLTKIHPYSIHFPSQKKTRRNLFYTFSLSVDQALLFEIGSGYLALAGSENSQRSQG